MKRFLWLAFLIAASPALANPAYNPIGQQVPLANSFIGASCVYESPAPTITPGNVIALHCDKNGNLATTGGGGGGGGSVTQGTVPWVVSGSVSVSNFPTTQPVSGSVSVSNFPSTQAVTGTFWQTTQPVSGTFFQSLQPVSCTAANCTVVANAGTGTFTVGQATGTNLHTVVDSGSVSITGTLPTSILPYAATNAQTAVANSFVGSACTYSSSPPTLTNGQVNPVQCDPAAKLYADVIGTVTVANTPAPALQAGSGGTNLSSTMEDTRTETGSITTATTTLVKAGTAGQRIFVSYAAFDSSGTNTAATFVFIQGTTTTTPCDTNASNLWLDSESVFTGALSITPAYSGAAVTAASGSVGIIPAAKEWPLTTGYSLCITTAGTTIAGNAVVLSATHL